MTSWHLICQRTKSGPAEQQLWQVGSLWQLASPTRMVDPCFYQRFFQPANQIKVKKLWCQNGERSKMWHVLLKHARQSQMRFDNGFLLCSRRSQARVTSSERMRPWPLCRASDHREAAPLDHTPAQQVRFLPWEAKDGQPIAGKQDRIQTEQGISMVSYQLSQKQSLLFKSYYMCPDQ